MAEGVVLAGVIGLESIREVWVFHGSNLYAFDRSRKYLNVPIDKIVERRQLSERRIGSVGLEHCGVSTNTATQ